MTDRLFQKKIRTLLANYRRMLDRLVRIDSGELKTKQVKVRKYVVKRHVVAAHTRIIVIKGSGPAKKRRKEEVQVTYH